MEVTVPRSRPAVVVVPALVLLLFAFATPAAAQDGPAYLVREIRHLRRAAPLRPPVSRLLLSARAALRRRKSVAPAWRATAHCIASQNERLCRLSAPSPF
jgi:hypothetical protein